MKDVVLAIIAMPGGWFVLSAPLIAFTVWSLIRYSMYLSHLEYLQRFRPPHD